jgi:hypothetical protein
MTSQLRDDRARAHARALLDWAGRRDADELSLAVRLLVENAETARASADEVRALHGGVYDEKRTVNFITEVSDREAAAIAKSLGADPDWDAFERAAPGYGTTQATFMTAWGAREFGRQQPSPWTKTWHTAIVGSRHGDVNGETVGIEDFFSNGAQFPGDPALGTDSTAGCICFLEVNPVR